LLKSASALNIHKDPMHKAKHKTGIVFFPAFDWAISPTHPEREERLLYTQDQVIEDGVFDIEGIVELKPDIVTVKDVQRVHFCVPDVWGVMTESHFISAGGAKTVGMAVMGGEVKRGFALVRPPGHHAMRIVHGARGFCNINIEAIMVEFLRQAYKVRRVAIVDTDCHHGDGTQDIYWHDPETLFISLHQDGRTLYPGTGFADEMGGPNAVGATINIPLPPNTGDDGFLYTMDQVVMPILDEFKPELIINSAGQDNHFSDPITNMNFSAQGYAELTRKLNAHIAVLEGGYSIEGALPYVNLGIILAMAGLDTHAVREPNFDPKSVRQSSETTAYIRKVCEKVMENWRQKERLQKEVRRKGPFIERRRNVFYDTDNIQERQQETIRVCQDCGGVWKVDSAADKGKHILAVHIPRNACERCRQTGYEWFAAGEPKLDHVFLQDRTTDRYVERKKS
jgi:acetoin utilization deacetylase AcuC-like enzyme